MQAAHAPAHKQHTWGALERSSATIDITKPGVQKPHWLPCALARRS